MSVESIEFISEGADVSKLSGLKLSESSNSFGSWIGREMNSINQQIQNAEVQVQRLAAGEEDNLHHIMLTVEKAKLSFELALQVRNKLLEGYQEIMRMQV